MKPSERSKLIGKFWEGGTTRSEDEELFCGPSYEGFSDCEKAYFGFLSKEKEQNCNDEKELWDKIIAREKRKKKNFYLSTGIAASLLLLISLFFVKHTTFNEDDFKSLFSFNRQKNYLADAGNDSNCNLTLYINGCPSSSDFHTILQTINPNCIKQINFINEPNTSNKKENGNGKVEVWLKGESNEIFSICEGTLYFSQDGEMKSININDKFAPNLLINCKERPLSEILKLKPQQIKSIELTSNPRNCTGTLNGEYIVMELK